MSLVFLSFFLAGCESLPASSGDVGTVTVTCTFDYTFPEGRDTGDWPGFSTDCDSWAESGEQSFFSTWSACEEAGLAEGADPATCDCAKDFGTCTFPNGVND